MQRFAKIWNFDIALGQVYDTKNGAYTGMISGEKYLVEQKGDLLKELVKTNSLSWEGSIAVGDSMSDASILEVVEQPIVFNPDDQLFNRAKERHWKIVIERKNVIYELERHGGAFVHV